jgi:hypothetical protein
MRGLRCPQCGVLECRAHHYVWVDHTGNERSVERGYVFSCEEWFFLARPGAQDQELYMGWTWQAIQSRAHILREAWGEPGKGGLRTVKSGRA